MSAVLEKHAGFCFGVKRAMDLVLDAVIQNQGKRIYTYGPLVHNEEVVKFLEEKGVLVLHRVEDAEKGSIVVIRSHGVPPDVETRLKEQTEAVLDATCPKVKRIHRLVEKHTAEGYPVLVIGKKDHPEVIGIVGYGRGQATAIDSIEDLKPLLDLFRHFLPFFSVISRLTDHFIGQIGRKRL